MSKKKKDDTKKAASKAPVSKGGEELCEDQLEQVSGGANGASIKNANTNFLKIDDANADFLKID